MTLFLSSFAVAASVSPLLGTWEADVSRLPVPPEARPKSVTMTYTDVGSGRWRADVDIRGGDGSDRQMSSTCALDGSACRIQGDMAEADTAAMKNPQPGVLILTLVKGSIPASTRVYAVAPDGKTMVETAVYFTDDGKPIMRTNYFNRMK